MADLIKKEMGLMDVIKKYPQTVQVFQKHGLGCIGCALANFETVEQGAMGHGMELEPLLKDLNAAAAQKS